MGMDWDICSRALVRLLLDHHSVSTLEPHLLLHSYGEALSAVIFSFIINMPIYFLAFLFFVFPKREKRTCPLAQGQKLRTGRLHQDMLERIIYKHSNRHSIFSFLISEKKKKMEHPKLYDHAYWFSKGILLQFPKFHETKFYEI